MKLIWKNGEEVIKSLLVDPESELIGITFNNQKPDLVELSYSDIAYLLSLDANNLESRMCHLKTRLKKNI